MKKIIRIEDITEIVGMRNYIDALSLNQDFLTYCGYQKQTHGIVFHFQYEIYEIHIEVDKVGNIKQLSCNCSNSLKHCSHIALCIMFLMSHHLIEKATEELNNDYDAEFNQLLFDQLLPQETSKIKLNLEVLLKEIDRKTNEYELQIRIGETKTYVLKKHIKEFYNVYQSKQGEVVFGQNFIYNPKIHYFDEVDTKIIDFLNIYIDSQIPRYGYYNYYDHIPMIKLAGQSLKSFMKLLVNKNFQIEYGYDKELFRGIFNSDFDITIKKMDTAIQVSIDLEEKIAFTNDYHYIIVHHNMYHLGQSQALFLKTMIENHKKEIIFKKNELGLFSNYVYPILNQLSTHITMDENLKDKFIDSLKVKYYIDFEQNRLICTIKLGHKDYEFNIMKDFNSDHDFYVTRDHHLEKQYIRELSIFGFQCDQKKEYYYLTGDRVVDFLNQGLKELSSKYEVYLSDKVKNTNIIKKMNIKNTFQIGKENILTYHFNIENIDPSEIASILANYREKKHYYRLKNGDYLSLDQKELSALDDLLTHLNIQAKDLKDQMILPTYQSMHIHNMLSNDFICINNQFEKLIQDFYRFKDSEIHLSSSDIKILRDYQITGVKWMNIISKCGFGGILADEMGLGKSIQTIQYIKQCNKDSKTLIVVPTSLIYNWENEFHKFGKGLTYCIINGSQPIRHKLIHQIKKYNVLITTYGLLRNDIEQYMNYHFDNFILDEAQNIKNYSSETTKTVKKIQAKTKFALTGTPIENSILELWSIFDFIMPGFLPPLSIFKKQYPVKNIDENEKSIENLNKKISPFILRRKKKDVLSDLPDKIENHILVELNEEQKKLYLAQLEKTKEKIQSIIQEDHVNQSSILILSLLTKLRQLCIDPRLVVEGNLKSSKLDTLMDLLIELKKEHKVLIFSQFPSALKLLIPELKKKKIGYYYLDGKTKSKTRMELVEKFNQDDTTAFLISLKAGGTGLNLTSADVVIHLDPWWNPQVENQATDRSHRIGQKKVVQVIKLIAKGTIEEKIVELQHKKQALSDKIIEGENRSMIHLSKLDVEKLKELFEI